MSCNHHLLYKVENPEMEYYVCQNNGCMAHFRKPVEWLPKTTEAKDLPKGLSTEEVCKAMREYTAKIEEENPSQNYSQNADGSVQSIDPQTLKRALDWSTKEAMKDVGLIDEMIAQSPSHKIAKMKEEEKAFREDLLSYLSDYIDHKAIASLRKKWL